MTKTIQIAITVASAIALLACSTKEGGEQRAENTATIALLQGMWQEADNDILAMKVSNDTIFYADSIMQPARYHVYDDSLIICSTPERHYLIKRISENILHLQDNSKEILSLHKVTEQEYAGVFNTSQQIHINQGEVIKGDTVVRYDDHSYHIYTQVNPTTYKTKVSSTEEGGSIYYDNIINLSIFDSGRCIIKSDIRKTDFSKEVPASYMEKAVLNSVTFDGIDTDGLHFKVSVAIPDSQSDYIINLMVSFNGKITKSI